MTKPAKTRERWTLAQLPDQTGRTIIVTGANSGLGYASTRALAVAGAHVVMAVRSETRGRQALDTIAGELPGASLELRPLDLADLDSVRAFADAVRADGLTVDVLMNNAGIMMPPRSLSPQGSESQFAANHLGHFALTGLLLDSLAASTDARVVTVSSNMHKRGRIHFDDLTGERAYAPMGYYAQSKFANTVFGLELDRRLRAAGSPVRSVLAHPGYSATNLQNSGSTGVVNLLMRLGTVLMAQSVSAGALPQLYAATDPRVRGGDFVGPDGLAENRGYPILVKPIAAATDRDTARRLWDISEELTGVHYGLPVA
jgi:NAD(P)-dependent dehydrogenase (short-subunit alcohol dehydrogenase family)